MQSRTAYATGRRLYPRRFEVVVCRFRCHPPKREREFVVIVAQIQMVGLLLMSLSATHLLVEKTLSFCNFHVKIFYEIWTYLAVCFRFWSASLAIAAQWQLNALKQYLGAELGKMRS